MLRLIICLFLVCCGLAASLLDSVVSSAFTGQNKSHTYISKSQLVVFAQAWDTIGIWFLAVVWLLFSNRSTASCLEGCHVVMGWQLEWIVFMVFSDLTKSMVLWSQCGQRASTDMTGLLLRWLQQTGLQMSMTNCSKIATQLCSVKLFSKHSWLPVTPQVIP